MVPHEKRDVESVLDDPLLQFLKILFRQFLQVALELLDPVQG